MQKKLLLTVLVLMLLGSAVGCVPGQVSAPTPIPFFTITPTAPTLPPPTPTAPPTATPMPSATLPPAPTNAPKAAATPTRTQTRPSSSPTAQPPLVVQTVLVGPGKPGRLYALLQDEAGLRDHKISRIVLSNNMGATWSAVPGGLPVSQDCMYNINLDYATIDELYASTCQGIYHWTGQDKWRRISDLKTYMVAVTYHQPAILWASVVDMNSGPVVRTTNGGGTWQAASDGLVHFNGVANVGIDPRDPKTLYAIIWPKYGGSYLRRKMGENQWETMPTPLDNSQIDVGMTIDGATGALYVTVNDMTTNPAKGHWQVWRTPNPTAEMNNIKWEQVYDFGDNQWATILASGWSAQGLALFARVRLPNQQQALMRSMDSGKTWSVLKIP